MTTTASTPTKPKAAPVSVRELGDWHILRRAFGYLRPYRNRVVGEYVALAGTTTLTLLIPQFIRVIVDRGIRQQEIAFLAWSALGLLGVALLKGIITFFEGRWSEIASQSVAYDLRHAIHRKLAHLSFAYHDQAEAGQLLSRAMQDVERVRFLTGRATLGVVRSIVLLVGTAIILVFMNPGLALLSLITMPLLAWRGYAFGRHYRPLALAIQQQLGVLTAWLEQNLRGARIVKAFAREATESQHFDRQNDAWFTLSAHTIRLQAINIPLLDLIANMGTVFIVWYGGTLVINGQLTPGDLIAFLTYLAQLTHPMRRLGFIIPAMAMAASAGERVFEILDAPSPVRELPTAQPLPPVAGHVRFEEVFFGYETRPHVLNGVRFEAKPGQIIALLGATGSGKSSIINLIPRFYDPTAGRITIDGQDIGDVTLESLRDQIGIVLQETTLFASTIRENIAFGRPTAAQGEVVEAARAAQAHDFICEMPDGYETRVGERGMTLSGGQKQRIAIARALLKNPRILLLDDATSSVDTETERLIQLALDGLMQGRTSFVIAQRLSTVRTADLILVLEDGKIAEMGQHAELLETSALYADIYRGQLQRALDR